MIKRAGRNWSYRIDHKENAVSVVVGVMLMLVVTIILAAVVSSYSGSMISMKEKPLQVTITARTNGADEIFFDHTGGDQFSIDDLVIMLDQGDQTIRINNQSVDRPDSNLTNKAGISLVRPGDTIILRGTSCSDPDGKYTCFNTSESSIIIEHNHKEFGWTLLSKKADAILARGNLAFYSI